MAAHVLNYSKNAVFHPVLTKKIYETYMKSMNIPRDPYSVMDVGCGDGRVLFDILHPLLPSNYKEIIGSDKDKSMIEYCRSINKRPNISFLEMNIEMNQLPEKLENRFDAVFSSYCLMLVRNLRQGLVNCRKMLKPNGEILMLFISKKNPLFSTYAELNKMDTWKPYTKDYEGFVPHFSSKDPNAELEALFEHVELEVLSKEFLHDFTYNLRRRNLLELVKSMDTVYRTIPEDKQEEYRKDFKRVFSEVSGVDMMDEANLDDISTAHIPNVVIHARKP